MDKIQALLKTLPKKPGVYLMKNKDGEVIYVGKAKILNNRVRQYFQNNSNHPEKVKLMVKQIDSFEFIITNTEFEALVLECNLIKKIRPKYNILLKDGKHYPFIKVTVKDPYPKVLLTRKMENDGNKYYGPYLNSYLIMETIDLAKKIFGIYSCNKRFPADFRKTRPCLNYHIKQCMGVCRGNISSTEYHKIIDEVCLFLEGRHMELLEGFRKEMIECSKRLEFEKAAKLRDRIAAIEKIFERQKAIGDIKKEQDIIALTKSEKEICIVVFFVRNGKMLGRESFKMSQTDGEEDIEIISEFLKQYYEKKEQLPKEIILGYEIDHLLKEYLCQLAGRKVLFTCPQKGEKKELLQMAEQNANNQLFAAVSKDELLMKVKDVLGLTVVPRRIESYDISHSGGDETVGMMVVFQDGKPKKSEYRKFKMKTDTNKNDYLALCEMIERRFLHREKDLREGVKNGRFELLPDLILLDGGKGQVSGVKRTVEKLGLNLNIFGLVKDEKHRTRAVTDEKDEIKIPIRSDLYKFFFMIQEEVHKNAISYHRKRMSGKMTSSSLLEIKGIGASKTNALFQQFKTLERIKNASVEELAAVKGITRQNAEEIFRHYHKF